MISVCDAVFQFNGDAGKVPFKVPLPTSHHKTQEAASNIAIAE